jgi:sulfate adenylyltransferase subunit 1
VPLFCDTYARNRATGSFILVDEFSHATLAAGMIVATSAAERPESGLLEMGGL